MKRFKNQFGPLTFQIFLKYVNHVEALPERPILHILIIIKKVRINMNNYPHPHPHLLDVLWATN